MCWCQNFTSFLSAWYRHRLRQISLRQLWGARLCIWPSTSDHLKTRSSEVAIIALRSLYEYSLRVFPVSWRRRNKTLYSSKQGVVKSQSLHLYNPYVYSFCVSSHRRGVGGFRFKINGTTNWLAESWAEWSLSWHNDLTEISSHPGSLRDS